MKNFDHIVKQLTVNLQKLGVVLVVLTAILAGVNACLSQFRFDQVEEIADIETKSAQMDGQTDATPYRTLFDALDEKCFENRTQIIGIARTISKKTGHESDTYLVSLQDLYSEVDAYTTTTGRTQIACVDIVDHY